MNNYGTYYDIYIMFFKINSDYKVLRNQKYEFVSYDKEKSTGIFLEEGEYGQYYCKSTEEGTSFALDIIPQYLKEEFDNIHTFEDYMALADRLGDHFQLHDYYSSGMHNLPMLSGVFNIPVKLKQIESTPGYKNQDLGVLFSVYFDVSYDRSTHEVLYKDISASAWETKFFDLNEFKNIRTVNDLVDLTNDNAVNELACINTENDRIIMNDQSKCTVTDRYGSSYYVLVPYVMDEEGTVKLEISNTVNGLTKYNATSSRSLEYKIMVENKGDMLSTDNIVITNVPKHVIVDETSISDSGVYNKNESIITWRIDKISANERKMLSYKAQAPNYVNGEELIGSSNVYSTQSVEKTYSNMTIVTLDRIVEIINNPNTGTRMIYIPKTNIGMPLGLLFILLIIFSFITFLVAGKLHNMKYTKKRM